VREERIWKVEDRRRTLEERLEREQRQREEWWKEKEKRPKDIDVMLEKEAGKKTKMDLVRQDFERDDREKLNKTLMERIEGIDDKIKEAVKSQGIEGMRSHERIDILQSEMSKDRTERQDNESNMRGHENTGNDGIIERDGEEAGGSYGTDQDIKYGFWERV
jgi:hypothetical protein